jgi:hypothetical protein
LHCAKAAICNYGTVFDTITSLKFGNLRAEKQAKNYLMVLIYS